MARNGTAAGRSGEEKTGGPGGVLRCAVAGLGPEPGLGVPRAAARQGHAAKREKGERERKGEKEREKARRRGKERESEPRRRAALADGEVGLRRWRRSALVRRGEEIESDGERERAGSDCGGAGREREV